MVIAKAELDRLAGSGEWDTDAGVSEAGGLDDLAAARWMQAFDAAWLSHDWIALERYMAPDVVVMLASGSTLVGRASVLAHVRATMYEAEVHEYNATDLTGHTAGTIAIIAHRWQLDWTVDHRRREVSGRGVLVLRRVREDWQLVWHAMSARARR